MLQQQRQKSCNFHRNIHLLLWNWGEKTLKSTRKREQPAQKWCQRRKELIKAASLENQPFPVLHKDEGASLGLILHIPQNLRAGSAASTPIFLWIISIPANCRDSCFQQRMNKQVPAAVGLVPAAAAGQTTAPNSIPWAFPLEKCHSLLTKHWRLLPNQLFDPDPMNFSNTSESLSQLVFPILFSLGTGELSQGLSILSKSMNRGMANPQIFLSSLLKHWEK